MAIPPMWQFHAVDLVLVIFAVCNELGRRRLAPRQSQSRRHTFFVRALILDAAIVLLIVGISGPLEHWGMSRLAVHMVAHVIEMFYIPILLVIAGVQVPLWFALPLHRRRRLLCWYYLAPQAGPLRLCTRVVTNKWVALIGFNATMVFWHIPKVFDWSMDHEWSHAWLMTPSFVLFGVLFWRLLLGSHPRPPRSGVLFQLFAIIVTAFEMLLLAMALAIFSHGAWYSMNVMMEGGPAALRDQHIAAGILWICGDLWAIPMLAVIAMRAIERRGSISMSVEKALGRV